MLIDGRAEKLIDIGTVLSPGNFAVLDFPYE